MQPSPPVTTTTTTPQPPPPATTIKTTKNNMETIGATINPQLPPIYHCHSIRKLKLENIGIGTWNVWTLSYTGALVLAVNELERYRWDIIGLCETRWLGKGEYSRLQSSNIPKKNAIKAIIGYRLESHRLMSARLRTKFSKMTVIQAYIRYGWSIYMYMRSRSSKPAAV